VKNSRRRRPPAMSQAVHVERKHSQHNIKNNLTDGQYKQTVYGKSHRVFDCTNNSLKRGH